VLEVVVVYSNSPAEFLDYCTALLPRYAKHFEVRAIDSGSESNGAIARNAGIQNATAPLLALLDDDDEWLPGKLDAYLRHIQALSLVGDFVIFSQVVSCRDDRTAWQLFPSIPYGGEPIADYVFSPLGGAQTSSLLLPTALARRVGFDPQLVRHQDYDFCMRLEEVGARFYAIHRPLSYWYQRGSGAAKGGTFEFCSKWIGDNADRMSRSAYVSYIEKELFFAARQTGRWRDLLHFMWRSLAVNEFVGSLLRLAARAVRSGLRRVSPRRPPFAPL
jgi:glycosyltransferase involved in cell wall biosynthesis